MSSVAQARSIASNALHTAPSTKAELEHNLRILEENMELTYAALFMFDTTNASARKAAIWLSGLWRTRVRYITQFLASLIQLTGDVTERDRLSKKRFEYTAVWHSKHGLLLRLLAGYASRLHQWQEMERKLFSTTRVCLFSTGGQHSYWKDIQSRSTQSLIGLYLRCFNAPIIVERNPWTYDEADVKQLGELHSRVQEVVHLGFEQYWDLDYRYERDLIGDLADSLVAPKGRLTSIDRCERSKSIMYDVFEREHEWDREQAARAATSATQASSSVLYRR